MCVSTLLVASIHSFLIATWTSRSSSTEVSFFEHFVERLLSYHSSGIPTDRVKGFLREQGREWSPNPDTTFSPDSIAEACRTLAHFLFLTYMLHSPICIS